MNCSVCDKHVYQFLYGGNVCSECVEGKRFRPRVSVLQNWVMELPFMMQSVLISAIRGPDGVIKNHPSKMLCRWLRRCVLLSAFDKCVLDSPWDERGGSYTGPSITFDINWEPKMDIRVKEYLDAIDSLPHHFHLHILHAAEILGYRHPNDKIRDWWLKTYQRMVHDMHLAPETSEQLGARLNDDRDTWAKDETRFKK